MIQVDVREHQLINLLQNIDNAETKHITTLALEIGDIIICNKLIIERKSVADLYSSILDGRYEEQSYRLSNVCEHHNHNVVYLIEGDISRHKHKGMLMSALFSINYYKGFSVMRTYNIQETADYVWNTFKKMTKENKPGYYDLSIIRESPSAIVNEETSSSTLSTTLEESNTTTLHTASNPTEKDYVSVVKKCKKDNITENNIDEIMLCQIPGISTQSAISIVRHLGSIRDLVKRYEEEGDAIFSDIRVTSTTGKETKLNKTIVQNIKRFLIKVGVGAGAGSSTVDVDK